MNFVRGLESTTAKKTDLFLSREPVKMIQLRRLASDLSDDEITRVRCFFYAIIEGKKRVSAIGTADCNDHAGYSFSPGSG